MKLKTIATISALSVLTVLLFAGTVTADQSALQQMDGDGTEDDPYVITDVEELQAMSEDRSAHYVLGNDIDASETAAWNAGAGFEPIGEDDTAPFTGTFDGQGHAISGLSIDRPGRRNVALFGYATGTIENVHLENVDVRGGDRRVGGLVGETTGTVSDVSVTGSVEGEEWSVGGVAGSVEEGGRIERSSSDAAVSGATNVGVLVGNGDGLVTESVARGDVSAEADDYGGGLVGGVGDEGAVRQSYATSDASGEEDARIAGITGYNGGTISDVFATGSIEDTGRDTGGVVVRTHRESRAVNAYWDVDATGQRVGAPYTELGTGLRTAEMTGPEAETAMGGLDFDHFWTLTDAYPVLEWQVEDVSVSLAESTVTEGDRTDVTVTVTLDDGSTVTASEVADYATDGGAAVDAGVVEASEQGTAEITATVAGESDTAALEITEPPNIELDDTALDAAAVVEGTPVTATATYVNDGGPGGHTATLLADGETVASERVSLGADDEATVEFEWTPDGSAGSEYELAIDETALDSLTVSEPGTVSLESASIPESVGTGTPYELAVTLGNEADEPVAETVEYELDGDGVAREVVTVDPDGSTATLAHETDAEPGQTVRHAVTVRNQTIRNASGIATPPEFVIDGVEAPDEVESGEAFELTVTVENTGGSAGTRTVAVSDDEGEITNRQLTLEPDASETVPLSVDAADTDRTEYDIEVGDEEASVTVTTTTGAEPGDSEDAESGDGVPGFGPAAAVVALSLVTGLIRRRTSRPN